MYPLIAWHNWTWSAIAQCRMYTYTSYTIQIGPTFINIFIADQFVLIFFLFKAYLLDIRHTSVFILLEIFI